MDSKKTLQSRIGRLQVLQGPEWQTPPPSKALSLIRRLANDPGIVGIMKKHDWHIGELVEMPPEGYVGVSPTCVLGVNYGKGIRISLRLRTDDHLGFRKYHVIRSTLLHELAHNDISEHDQSFWTLVSKLNKEVVELDWTKSSGHTTGRSRRPVYSDRLSASERGDSSSDEDEPLLDDPDPEGYLLGGSSSSYGRSRLLDLTPPAPITQKDTNQSKTISQPEQQKQEDTPAESNKSDTKQDEEIPTQPRKKVKTYWRCPDCSYHNDLHLQKCLSCGETAPLLRTNMMILEPKIEEIGMDVTEIHDPVVIRSKKLEACLRSLVQETDPQSAKVALETIEMLLGNILLFPDQEKYRTIFLSNKAFYQKVARHPSAIEFLKEVGFSDEGTLKSHDAANPWRDTATPYSSGEKLVFKRNDLGLLWMAKSSIQMKLETFLASIQIVDETVPVT